MTKIELTLHGVRVALATIDGENFTLTVDDGEPTHLNEIDLEALGGAIEFLLADAPRVQEEVTP